MSVKKLYVNAYGGLANRMRSIACGLSLARDTARRLVVVWHADSGLNARYHDVFAADYMPFELISPGCLCYMLKYDMPRKRNLYLSGLYQASRFAERFFDEANLLDFCGRPAELRDIVSASRGDVYIMAGINYYDFDIVEYRRLFAVSDKVAVVAESVLENLPDEFIGIHIRRTDNAVSIKNSPVKLFLERIAAEVALYPQAVFYLATDDDGVKRLFDSAFPQRVSYAGSTARRDICSGIVDAMAEMLVLSKACKIYGSYYSSYSEAASMLGDVPLEIVREL